MRPYRLVVLGLLFAGASIVGAPAGAQVLSPGKLSAPHAELEGLRQCTACHQLGKAGISGPLCLECHTSLGERITAGRGLHAKTSSSCAECHKEHLGRAFALVRLDTAAFDHEEVGYALSGGHAAVDCRGCHVGGLVADPAVRRYATEHGVLDRTFLGLPTACATCHREDDPHGRQFEGRACTDCHDTGTWESTPRFSHKETRYPLTGRHAQVDCGSCHGRSVGRAADRSPAATAPVRDLVFRPLDFGACTACHLDPHRGGMQGRCESCHTTVDWQRIDRGTLERRFDHGRTGFELAGRHAQLSCASCHDARTIGGLDGIRIQFAAGTTRRAYPSPRVGSCLACHVDEHEGAFGGEGAREADCAGCHGEQAWLPARYDLPRHDRDSGFELAGAHRAVACADCHRTPEGVLALHPASGQCTDCHAEDDPHEGQFPGRACSVCHEQESFRIEDFDHSVTRFALDGVHAKVACVGCHERERSTTGEEFVRYAPLGTACRDCHQEGR